MIVLLVGIWTTVSMRSVTLVLPICLVGRHIITCLNDGSLRQLDLDINAWIGKDWQDTREKARVITYEGSSCRPCLEVIFKTTYRSPRRRSSCRHISVDDQSVSTYSSRCFVTNKKQVISVWLGDYWVRGKEEWDGSSYRHEIQNEALMRVVLLGLALYKLWTLLRWRLDINGLLGKKDYSSHRFEEVWTFKLAMTTGLPREESLVGWWWYAVFWKFVKIAQGRQYAKIKMQIVLALIGLRCERLIYTALLNWVTNTRITHGTNLIGLLPRTFLASTTPDKTSTVTVFRPSFWFKTGAGRE